MTKRKKKSERSVEAAPKYEPTKREATAIAALDARADGKPRLPRVIYCDGNIRIDHKDEWTGAQLMMQACGASNPDAFTGLIEHLARFCSGTQESVERQINALLAGIASIGPRDDIEMMLAAQMVLAHELSMKMARQVRHADTIPQQDSAERGFNKMTRTYTTQMEALRKHRHGGQQKVTVEHVTVNSGGQVIVGNVEAGGRGEQSGR